MRQPDLPVDPSVSRTLGRASKFTPLIVELGVLSSLAFSLALFIAATMQAYHTIGQAFRHLGEQGTTKHLLVAAVEQEGTLLVGVALLIISLGLQALFIGQLSNVSSWLHVHSFDDLKQKLLGVVVTALAVNFFAVALEWLDGPDILTYGAAIAAVILAVGAYSVVLGRQKDLPDRAEPDRAEPDRAEEVPGAGARP